MATHAVFAALAGMLLLAIFILTVGDPSRALSVWLVGAAAGGTASVIGGASPRLRQLFTRRRGA